MKKLFQLNKKVEEELPTSLRDPIITALPEALKRAFKENGKVLSNNALVMMSGEDGNWRVVDYNEDDVFAFDIRRERDEFNVFQPTASGLSDRLFDYPIFETGIPLINDQGEEELKLISGIERYFLTDKQKRKWDYFFPPFRPLVGLSHRLKTLELSAEAKKKKEGLGSRRALVWVLLSAAIASVIFIGATAGASLIGTALLFIIWLVNWGKLRKQYSAVSKVEKIIERYQDELRHLEQQLPNEVLSNQEISKMYNEELSFLDDEAIEMLGLEADTILELDGEINPRGVKGIVIEDWALIQPESSAGRNSLRQEHVEAVVVGEDGLPRFAVYFVQFIYPTDDLISVYGCFYDFILSERKGLATDEFFYRNVVSVASKTLEEKSYLDPERISETTLFRLTVSSADSIQVALTDERVVDDMNRRFEAKRKLKRERRRKVSMRQEKTQKETGADIKEDDAFKESYDDNEHERLVRVAESELPATRARKAIAFIRRELRAKGRIDPVTG